jgi:hypothetical protein
VTIRIRRFEPGDRGAIERLNARLAAGGATQVMYGEDEGGVAPPYVERLFIAEDGDEVRGGVYLREQLFRVAGQDANFGWLKYPLSESLVDPAFNGVPGSLLIQLLRLQPRLLALGLGGHATPLAHMLSRLKWVGETVPFHFRVVRGAAALRELAPLRTTAARRAVARALGSLGVAGLGFALLHALRGVPGAWRAAGCTAEEVAAFGPWVDDLWARARDAYGFLACRDAATLGFLYRGSLRDLHRLRVRRHGEDIGWACIVCHDFAVGAPDANFGRLRVGLIADGLCLPGDAPALVGAAADWLRTAGVDLVVSNQLHPAWIAGLRSHGFLAGPSNFAFYRAPAADRLLSAAGCHINRGDCDGPFWYGAG